jgi:hypothetical protein
MFAVKLRCFPVLGKFWQTCEVQAGWNIKPTSDALCLVQQEASLVQLP